LQTVFPSVEFVEVSPFSGEGRACFSPLLMNGEESWRISLLSRRPVLPFFFSLCKEKGHLFERIPRIGSPSPYLSFSFPRGMKNECYFLSLFLTGCSFFFRPRRHTPTRLFFFFPGSRLPPHPPPPPPPPGAEKKGLFLLRREWHFLPFFFSET